MGPGKNQAHAAAPNSRRGRSRSKTPVLDNFSRDLTQMARENKLDQ